MTPKSNKKKRLTLKLQRRKGSQPVEGSSSPPPDILATDTEAPSTDEEEEPSLRYVMTLLGNMCDRLVIHEQRLGSLTAENDTSSQSFFRAPVAPSTSRTGAEGGGVTTGPQLAVQDNFRDMSEEVQARVPSCLRGARAPFLKATDEDTASDVTNSWTPHTRKGG